MANALYMHPSFYAHIVNGVLLLFALMVLFHHFDSLRKVTVYQLITLLLLYSIAAGVHGMSHLGLERAYGYNPLEMLRI